MTAPHTTRKLLQAAPLFLLIAAVIGFIVVYLTRDNDLQLARKALAQRRFDEADKHLQQRLKGHPDDVNALLLAAQSARRRGDLNTAADFLARSERRGRRPETAQEQLRLRIQGGNLAEVGAALDACLADPTHADNRLTLEAVLEASVWPTIAQRKDAPDVARLQAALDAWLTHARTPAEQVQGLVWRGRLQRFQGKHRDATADLRRAVELDPAHADARRDLAMLVAQEAPQEAAVHFQLLHERDPSNVQTSYSLATLRRGLGQLAEARRLLDDILLVQPANVSALIERAHVDLDQNLPEQAEPRLRRALDLAPREPEVSLALARCLQLAGKPDEAKKHQEQFLRLDAERTRKEQEKKP